MSDVEFDYLNVSANEQEAMLTLTCMFEKIDLSKVFEIVRKNNCDLDKCIDELLNLSIQEELGKTPVAPVVVLPSESSRDIEVPVALAREETAKIVQIDLPIFEPKMFDLQSKQEKILAKEKKLEEKIRNRARKLLMKKQKQQLRDKKKKENLIDFDNEVWISKPAEDNKPLVSLIPPRLNATEDVLLKRIADLESENNQLKEDNIRIETEKKNSMKWMIEQMELKLKDKDSQMNEMQEQIHRLEEVIHRLQLSVQQSRKQETKLENLLLHSKEVLVDGVQTLSKNVSYATEKGWTKVQHEFKDFDSNNKILERMKEFAQLLREEINNIFKFENESATIPSNSNTNVDSVSDEDEREQLSPEEEEEEQRAKIASLQTYVQETSRN